MSISIVKHQVHPIWKFYEEGRVYLGQILGADKEGMAAMAAGLLTILRGGEIESCKKEVLPDGSINIYNKANGKRIASFERDFEAIAKSIEDNK